ncbi:Mitoguardin 1 [Bienertia sinuspersici]
MTYSRALDKVWVLVVVVVAAIVVPENGRMCLALDTEHAKDINIEQPKETPYVWADQFSGKWADKQNMQEGAANLINKGKATTPDGMDYLSKKRDAVSDSTPSIKDLGVELYNEAVKKVEEAYDMVANNEEAKANYEAIKEKASDAAGEVGALMRH